MQSNEFEERIQGKNPRREFEERIWLKYRLLARLGRLGSTFSDLKFFSRKIFKMLEIGFGYLEACRHDERICLQSDHWTFAHGALAQVIRTREPK